MRAIELSNETETIKEAAISLGIKEEILYRWRKEFYQQEGEVFPGVGKSKGIKDAEQEELKRLRNEMRELKIERDILKKAISIFSKTDSDNTSL